MRAKRESKRESSGKDEGQENNESRNTVHTKDLEDVENSGGIRRAERERRREREGEKNTSCSCGSNEEGEGSTFLVDERVLSQEFHNEVQLQDRKTGPR